MQESSRLASTRKGSEKFENYSKILFCKIYQISIVIMVCGTARVAFDVLVDDMRIPFLQKHNVQNSRIARMPYTYQIVHFTFFRNQFEPLYGRLCVLIDLLLYLSLLHRVQMNWA